MKKLKTFTEEFTIKIANLSKLKLGETEIVYFTKQFNSTLETISNLNSINLTEVKEAYNITGLKNVFREDEIDPTRVLTQNEALDQEFTL